MQIEDLLKIIVTSKTMKDHIDIFSSTLQKGKFDHYSAENAFVQDFCHHLGKGKNIGMINLQLLNCVD